MSYTIVVKPKIKEQNLDSIKSIIEEKNILENLKIAIHPDIPSIEIDIVSDGNTNEKKKEFFKTLFLTLDSASFTIFDPQLNRFIKKGDDDEIIKKMEYFHESYIPTTKIPDNYVQKFLIRFFLIVIGIIILYNVSRGCNSYLVDDVLPRM
ncbi:hypothetical protein JXR93_00475 [bacterium]|nr:hypothetical protein [bacterium]